MARLGFPVSVFGALALAIAVSGCDTWFGEQEGAPLPGERMPVLLHERALSADPQLADSEILLPKPLVNQAWPQAGGYPNHAMHHLAARDDVQRLWKADVGTGSEGEERFVSSPIFADAAVFVIDADSRVSAFHGGNGRRLWSVDLTPDDEDDGHIPGGLAWDEGRLFVTTGFGEVFALEGRTGNVIWHHTLDDALRVPPTVRGGRVFVITVGNKLQAFSAADGKPLWNHVGIAEVASLLGGASPAVDGGIVIAPYSSGELVALSVDSGRMLWSDTLTAMRRTDVISSLSHIRGRPVIDRGLVFAVSHGGLMLALDLRTGRRVWEREIGGAESPWVAGDYVFVLGINHELVCLGRKDGRIRWVTKLPQWQNPEEKLDPIQWTGPILVSDRLVLANNAGEAMAVSPYSGQVMGVVEMPDAISVPPIVANGTLFFLTNDADLVAYR